MAKSDHRATSAQNASGKSIRFDIIYACDMSTASCAALRVAPEAAAAAGAGYTVGLLHLASAGSVDPISPEVMSAAQLHNLDVLDPEACFRTQLLLVHTPQDAHATLLRTTRIDADRVHIVADTNSALQDVRVHTATRQVSFASLVEGTSASLFPKAKIDRDIWPTVAEQCRDVDRPLDPNGLRIGFLGTRDFAADLVRVTEDHPMPGASIFVWTARGEDVLELPYPAMVLSEHTALDWFMRRIDVLVVGESQSGHTVTDVAISTAQSNGKPVILPHRMRDRFGDAALYGTAEEAFTQISELACDVAGLAKLRRKSRAFARRQFAAERYLKRLAKLLTPPKRRKAAHGGRATSLAPRVLFMPKGGVGLGHVARTLAVARHAGRSYVPVFATLSESAGLIGSLGFRAEYIPSAAYADLASEDWDPWFEEEIKRLIDAYQASAVVFDGSDPSAALIEAVASRCGCKLGWIRRGMWAPGYDPSLHLSSSFDLILEPGELASALDHGATATRRKEALQVAPITLLERDELLPRDAAAQALGLDPARPAVLLQLGSGENRDIVGTLDHVITLLKEYPGLQIAVAEWANSPGTLRLWRGVKLLKGAPLSLYFNAFDFSIAAAGYNTFHETIAFGLPTIFMPNTARGMDDQQARAKFAQEKGAAIELPQSDLGDLPGILDLMMKDSFRDVMRENCTALYAGNGAREASARIAQLVN